jgi:hypothetical protein
MSRVASLGSIATCLTLSFACGDTTREENGSGLLTASATATASASSTTSASGATSSDSDSNSSGSATNCGGGTCFDVGAGSATNSGGDGTSGCDKVDFLFVVDNSGSMSDEQNFLKGSFPGFIDTIASTLDAQDYHIMAVSTDNGQNTGLSSTCTNGDCSCTPAPTCCQNACGFGGSTCNGFDCNNLPIGPCDTVYGSGKQWDEDGNDCMLADGRRYMVDTQVDVAGTFNCIASVGTYGSGDEKPMLSMTEAVSDPLVDGGGCNEAFLRPDAILVVVFITDEEDDNIEGDGSPGDPQAWYDQLVAYKGGDPNAIVVLGLIGDGDQPNPVCTPGADPNNGGNGAEDSPRLRAFTELFPHGSVGSVCASDYTPFFQDAVSIIDTTCDEFVPPG